MQVYSSAPLGATLQPHRTYAPGPLDAWSTGDLRLNGNEFSQARMRAAITRKLALTVGTAWAQTQKASKYDSGEYLYRVYCASCHGPSGAGDGPVASLLRTPPPDLRAIARAAGGAFPRDRIIASIDGRTLVRAHGTRDMPVWGDRLKVTEGPDEPVIRKRLESIAAHIESIQVNKP
jgi:mono/diheme cytochrome c family protein